MGKKTWNSNLMSLSSFLVFLIRRTRFTVLWFSGMPAWASDNETWASIWIEQQQKSIKRQQNWWLLVLSFIRLSDCITYCKALSQTNSVTKGQLLWLMSSSQDSTININNNRIVLNLNINSNVDIIIIIMIVKYSIGIFVDENRLTWCYFASFHFNLNFWVNFRQHQK